MFKALRHLFFTKKTSQMPLSRKRNPRRRRFESLEARLPLAATTLVEDFDGVPGLEVATIETDRVTIASTVNGTSKSYPLNAWNSVQAVDLDGVNGKELLFNNIRLTNGTPQPAKAMVLTFVADELKTYDVGSPNQFEFADLDGVGGPELIYSNVRLINGNAQPATASILNHSTRLISSYSVGSPNRFNVIDLDGAAGSEIAFTNLRIVSGTPQPATTTVLTYASNLVHSYDVGSPNRFDFVNLDGTGGVEIVYSNVRSVNGVPQAATATVLNQTDRRVNSFTVGSPTRFNIVNLDAMGGPELIFNNMRVVSGVPQPARTSILNYATNLVSTYDVGSPNQYEFANLDGSSGVEIVYSNVRSVSGVPQTATATILNQATGTVKAYAVGNPNRMSVLDLDGVAGAELLFDNIRSINGTPQAARAFIVTYASDVVNDYAVGSPTRFDIADLDGATGSEIVYSNVRTINGVPQSTTAVVVNPVAKSVKSYAVGNANQLSITSMDGIAGSEIVFTNVRSINGVPQPATTTILSYAADETKTYDVGSPNEFEYADLDADAGAEIVYTNLRVVNGVPQPATASVLSHANRTIDRYSIGSPNRRDIVDLDGVGGSEIVYSDIRIVNGVPQAATVNVVNQTGRTSKNYAVGNPNRLEFRNLDGVAGSEILLDNLRVVKGVPQPAKSTVVTFAADQVKTYDLGTANAFRFVDLDGVGGPEVVYTNLRTVNNAPQAATVAIVNATNQLVKKYNVGNPNTLSVLDLDGQTGSELVFTNVRVVNSIAQPAKTTVVDYVGDDVKTYDVGSPNKFEIADLDGAGGPEIVYSNMRVANGSPLSASIAVLDHTNEKITRYAVGNPNRLQIVDLDGNVGNELLFDNVRVVNGVPQSANATVLTYATNKLNTYNLGAPNRFEIVDLDGVGGPEVVYSNVRLVKGVPQTAVATILNQSAEIATNVNLGPAKQLQIRQLDNVAGAELLVVRAANLAVYELGTNVFTTYDVQNAGSFAFEDLDGVAGLEARFVTPTGSGILNHRLKQLV